MSTTWKDVDVECPFYLSSDSGFKTGYVVRCEGITEGGKLCNRFSRKEQMERHMEAYCTGSYIRCEIYEMLQRVHGRPGGQVITHSIPDTDSHFRLKPCGCGGVAEYVGYDTDEWAVRCTACGHEGVRGRFRHDVQIHWNSGGRFE